MVGKKETVTTRMVEMWLGDDGILRIITLPDTIFTLEDNQENTRLIQQILDGKRRPTYVDVRNMSWSDRESRNFGASEEVTKLISALALHVASPVERMIMMFFIRISKPPYPARMFTSETEALQWLQQFVDEP